MKIKKSLSKLAHTSDEQLKQALAIVKTFKAQRNGIGKPLKGEIEIVSRAHEFDLWVYTWGEGLEIEFLISEDKGVSVSYNDALEEVFGDDEELSKEDREVIYPTLNNVPLERVLRAIKENLAVHYA